MRRFELLKYVKVKDQR